ncbi:hypothetical protein WR25_26745 [Diploscapter pachys]|uniref:Uncharacterized protein n=1 Tax=Diploscapter pachys TaxID=2018661 RepID=A0A2A2JMN1_9BILA|nr:hypothetical protein WR25_26745 [Diploscapter pachys]
MAPTKDKKANTTKSELTFEVGPHSCPSNMEKVKQQQKGKDSAPAQFECVARNVIVMCNSQSIDDVCPEWIERCSQTGSYAPYDMNMPSRLPVERAITNYTSDAPLTRIGLILTQLTGRGLLYNGLVPDVIYTSPALRSIQTAIEIRRASRSKAVIRVEPGLFENTNLYSQGAPTFLNAKERLALCAAIDNNYSSAILIKDLFANREQTPDYNRRVGTVLNRIARKYEFLPVKKDLNYLIVGHPSTIDMAVGQLMRGPTPRMSTEADLAEVYKRVPNCAAVHFQMATNQWIVEEMLPVSFEGYTTAFDYNFVMRPPPGSIIRLSFLEENPTKRSQNY